MGRCPPEHPRDWELWIYPPFWALRGLCPCPHAHSGETMAKGPLLPLSLPSITPSTAAHKPHARLCSREAWTQADPQPLQVCSLHPALIQGSSLSSAGAPAVRSLLTLLPSHHGGSDVPPSWHRPQDWPSPAGSLCVRGARSACRARSAVSRPVGDSVCTSVNSE